MKRANFGVVLAVSFQVLAAVAIADEKDKASKPQLAEMDQRSLLSWLTRHEMAIVESGDIVEIRRHSGGVVRPLKLTHEVVAAMAKLPKLEKLDLSATIVNDEAFLGVEGFEALKELRLVKVAVGGDALRAFAKSKWLEDLSLIDIHKIGKGLNDIPADSLKTLSLEGSEVDDETIKTVARLHKLTRVGISSPLVSEKGIWSLASLPHVKYLYLHCPRVSFGKFDELTQVLHCLGGYSQSADGKGADQEHSLPAGEKEKKR
jgi:hypothetical protein